MWITHIRLTKILFRMHEPDKSKGRDLYGLCISLNSCEEICISAVLFVDPGYFVLVTEVVNADQFLFGSFSYQGKKGFFQVSSVCAGISGANTGWLARMDSNCFRLLKMRPWIVSASALFRARIQLKWPLWSQRGSEALEGSAL